MRLIHLSTLFALSLYLVGGQEPGPSPSRRDISLFGSTQDHFSLVTGAITKAIGMLEMSGNFTNHANGEFGAAATLYAQMSELDRLTNRKIYKGQLKKYFRHATMVNPKFLYKQNYGYAAVRAYATYRDTYFLDIAETSWAAARQYTISSEQASSRRIETKTFNLASCHETLAGGTYSKSDDKTSYLDGLASGMFLAVSALLAEATSNQTYLDAAIESAEFMQSQLLGQSSVLWDGIWSSSNHSKSCDTKNLTSAHGSGAFIEGLATLVGIRYNSSMESLLNRTIFAVTDDPLWHSDQVYKNEDDGGHYIVRALTSFYERNNTSSNLRDHIKEYITIQYNSIANRSEPSNNIYRLPWTSPTGTSFDGVNQTSALTVLLSAIQIDDTPIPSVIPSSRVIPASSPTTSLRPQSSTSLPVEPNSPNPSASSAQRNSAGVIVGSIFAGILLLGGLMAGTLFLRKRRRQKSYYRSMLDESSFMITPFTATRNAAPLVLREQHQRNRVKSTRLPEVVMGQEPASTDGLVGIPTVSMRTDSTRTQAANTENPPLGDGRERVLMEELLIMLSARMSLDLWNAGEVPPDYHEGHAM